MDGAGRPEGGAQARDPAVTRIAHVQACEGFGGAERQASVAIPRLASWGFDVVPLVGPTPLICHWLAQQDVRGCLLSRAFPPGWPDATGAERWAIPGRYRRAARKVAEQVDSIVAQGSFDLVLAAMPFAWYAATAAARRHGVPVVWHADRAALGAGQAAALWTWAHLRAPDLLVCASEAVRAAFAPLVPAPVEVVRNGVDLDMFRPGRGDGRGFRPAGAQLVVGFAGRLVPEKRPQDLIAVAARLLARHPHLVFLIAGEGVERERCALLARTAGIERSVRFLGFVRDMPGFLAACDVVMLPSEREGCPNAVLEAMAVERAVVVSATAAASEVVTQGQTGLIHPVRDVEAAADCVSRLLAAPAWRASLGKAAREHVRRHFDARVTVGRLAQVLKNTLEERARSSASHPLRLAGAGSRG